MKYILSAYPTLDEVINNKPQLTYWDELFSYSTVWFVIWIALVLLSITFIIIWDKFHVIVDILGSLTVVVTIFYSFVLLILPFFIGISKDWEEWEESYVSPYIEEIPSKSTSSINKREIVKLTESLFSDEGEYVANVVFNVNGELVEKSNVPLIFKGKDIKVTYSYLDTNEFTKVGYEKGYLDVKLIVPQDFQLE